MCTDQLANTVATWNMWPARVSRASLVTMFGSVAADFVSCDCSVCSDVLDVTSWLKLCQWKWLWWGMMSFGIGWYFLFRKLFIISLCCDSGWVLPLLWLYYMFFECSVIIPVSPITPQSYFKASSSVYHFTSFTSLSYHISWDSQYYLSFNPPKIVVDIFHFGWIGMRWKKIYRWKVTWLNSHWFQPFQVCKIVLLQVICI